VESAVRSKPNRLSWALADRSFQHCNIATQQTP